MEYARLTSDRAIIIHNAIINDGSFVGSEPWLEEHHITRDELDAFLEYGVRLSRMYEWRDENMDVPPMVETKVIFRKYSGDDKNGIVKWVVETTVDALPRILPITGTAVTAMLYPEQMPLPIDDMVEVDVATGEVM